MTYSHGMPAWEPDAGFALQDLTAFLVTTQLSCRWGQHGGKLVLRIKNVHYPHTENLPEVLGGFMSDSLHVGTAPLLSHWLQFSQGDECLHELPGVTSPDIHRLRCHIPSNTPPQRQSGRRFAFIFPGIWKCNSFSSILCSHSGLYLPCVEAEKRISRVALPVDLGRKNRSQKGCFEDCADSGNNSIDFMPKVR